MKLQSKLSPELAPVWKAVHARLSSGRPVSQVRVGPLSLKQQGALADLLGQARLPGQYAVIPLAHLDGALLEAVGAGSREVVAQLIGPVGDGAGDRQRTAEHRTALWEWLHDHPVVAAQPALADWAAAVRRNGLMGGSLSRTREELDRTLRVLERLPASGIPLPAFADEVLSETHALDEGRRCTNLVLRALAAIYGRPPPVDAQERRALWEQAGIAGDELSSTVLAAGLPATGHDLVSLVLRACRDAGQAAALTLRQLKSSGQVSCPAQDVWIFENPSLLTLALERFGPRCPPMVCTSGWPSSAGILLLQQLGSAGSRLHYHGDFDGEGLRIAANVVARTAAEPWRMHSQDYLSAIAEGPPVGRVTAVPWDADLAGHLLSAGVTVPEERLAPALLDELACLSGIAE